MSDKVNRPEPTEGFPPLRMRRQFCNRRLLLDLPNHFQGTYSKSVMASAPIIVGLGEILWDVFPDAKHFGGAPANFAVHSAALGADVSIVSAVGRDALGDEAIAVLNSLHMDTRHIQTTLQPTGTVTVNIDPAGKADYVFATDIAWDHLEWSDDLSQLATTTDVVCFGTLAQRSTISEELIHRFVRSTRPSGLRIFDVNLRQNFYSADQIHRSLELANVLKLNHEELPGIATDDCGGDQRQQLRHLREQFTLDLVAMTRGDKGALLISADEESDVVGVPAKVVDTVGAGDAFAATLAAGLLADKSLNDINHRACEIAAYVCTQSGATPPLPAELSRPFAQTN